MSFLGKHDDDQEIEFSLSPAPPAKINKPAQQAAQIPAFISGTVHQSQFKRFKPPAPKVEKPVVTGSDQYRQPILVGDSDSDNDKDTSKPNVTKLIPNDKSTELDQVRMENSQRIASSSAVASTSKHPSDDVCEVTSIVKPATAPDGPICMGQITVRALILQNVPYIASRQDGNYTREIERGIRLVLQTASLPPSTVDQSTLVPNDSKSPPNVKYTLRVCPPGSNAYFAVIDEQGSQLLGRALALKYIRVEGVIKLPALAPQNKAPLHLPVNLLVFTRPPNSVWLSQLFLSNRMFLHSPPDYNPKAHSGSPQLRNPHNAQVLNAYNANTAATAVADQKADAISKLFKSLDDNLGAVHEETQPSPNVATSMYTHQKLALTFMLQREGDGTVKASSDSVWKWKPRRNAYVNSVTGSTNSTMPAESRSCILADDMGLGKTISVIALVAHTLSEAGQFAKKQVEPLNLEEPPKPQESDSHKSPSIESSFAAAPYDMPYESTIAGFDAHFTPSGSKQVMNNGHFDGSLGISSPDHFTSQSYNEPKSLPNKAPKLSKKDATEQHKLYTQYQEKTARHARLKMKSRATLIICPLSTVSNWEEQFCEHWAITPQIGSNITVRSEGWDAPGSRHSGARRIKIYVYHGNNRTKDFRVLADHDVVITTYSTLSVEYAKQLRSSQRVDTDDSQSLGPTGDSITAPTNKKRKVKTYSSDYTSPLQALEWFRIVLDEAHFIKEISTGACRAACELAAERRICLTGTPVQNRIEDMYALVKFLRYEPFCNRQVWNEFIGLPGKNADPAAVINVQIVMRWLLLRRTKESKNADGTSILKLPPKRDEIRWLELSASERITYERAQDYTKRQLNEMIEHKNKASTSYVGILQEILRLRQLCCHPTLPRQGGGAEELEHAKFSAASAQTNFELLKEAGLAACSGCKTDLSDISTPFTALDDSDDLNSAALSRTKKAPKLASSGPGSLASSAQASRANSQEPLNSKSPMVAFMLECGHLHCESCFSRKVCPNWPAVGDDCVCQECQTRIQSSSDVVNLSLPYSDARVDDSGIPNAADMLNESFPESLDVVGVGAHSTKVVSLINDLVLFSRTNPRSKNNIKIGAEVADMMGIETTRPTKSVVFSQWTSFLDRIQDALTEARIVFRRLDGSMTREARAASMEALKRDPSCEVLLVSLKAGGVGLNLTSANRVYLMEPYWNPAAENQALDRVHRLGQTREVTTVKMLVKDSIEEKMLKVQLNKLDLANLTLKKGLNKDDLREQRLQDLRELFASKSSSKT